VSRPIPAKLIEVHWLQELGIAQALWVLEVERLGPFLVEGDRVYRGLPPYSMRGFGEATPEQEVV